MKRHHPLLPEDFPGNSHKFAVVDPTSQAKWCFTLTRSYDILNVEIKLPGYTGPSLKGDYMRIIPMNGGKPIMFDYTTESWNKRNKISVHVQTEIVQHGDVYGVHFVQTTSKVLPRYFLATADNKPQTLPGYEESVVMSAKDTMSALLCDIYSVDTQIVFGSIRYPGDLSLWAYRVILSHFPAFHALLKQASLANRDTTVGPLTLAATKVSLPVFATLLRFLYIGEIHRFNFPEHFAISKTTSHVANSIGGIKDSHHWQPLDLDTPLSAESVTWEELLDAATIYKVDALRAQCRAEVKSEAADDRTYYNSK
ncbi:hypothetical protein BGZ81_004951 [Podila clonocystis]|nr:hypothetical protein BGZ81_004951 [Podila clonocystis]